MIADPLSEARAALAQRQGAGARYDAPNAPHRELSWARLGTAYFARKLADLPDAQLRESSARPGCTRKRVIAATALQARAMAQAIELAMGCPTPDPAETDDAALQLAETLPARALRHLVAHAAIHLNVVWRDLAPDQWDLPLTGISGAPTIRATAGQRARALWIGACDLGNGGRLADAPADLRPVLVPGF